MILLGPNGFYWVIGLHQTLKGGQFLKIFHFFVILKIYASVKYIFGTFDQAYQTKARNPWNTVAAMNPVIGGHFRILKVIRWSNTGFVAAPVCPGFLAFD